MLNYRNILIAFGLSAIACASAMANGTTKGCEAFAKGAELAQAERWRGTSKPELDMQVDTAWQAYANAAGLSNYEYQMMRSGSDYGYESDSPLIQEHATEHCRNNRV